MKPKLPRLEGIRAVVFDLYGTLLISAAGGGSHEVEAGPDEFPGFGEAFRDSIRIHQERARDLGIAFPEVEIREVWADTLAALGRTVPSPAEIEEIALLHECRVNPVWPMPGASETLAALRRSGFLLGIISNAQFYTLPVMEGLFGADLDGLGFERTLRVFSFEEGEGKPSAILFERLAGRAGAFGISPAEIFYLGNDFQKDVLPARAAGFRTGLFAGDASSFRLGNVAPRQAAGIADAVITDLAQVSELFHASA